MPSIEKNPEQESEKYPKVEGGGSLLLAWRIKNKHVLVVGGGEVCYLDGCNSGSIT